MKKYLKVIVALIIVFAYIAITNKDDSLKYTAKIVEYESKNSVYEELLEEFKMEVVDEKSYSHFSFPVFYDSENADKINKIISENYAPYLPEDPIKVDVKENLPGQVLDEYTSLPEKFTTKGKATVIYNKDGLLTLQFYHYSFSFPMPHPFTYNRYALIDSKSGNKLSLDDLFIENYQMRLEEEINIAFKDAKMNEENPSYDDLSYDYSSYDFPLKISENCRI